MVNVSWILCSSLSCKEIEQGFVKTGSLKRICNTLPYSNILSILSFIWAVVTCILLQYWCTWCSLSNFHLLRFEAALSDDPRRLLFSSCGCWSSIAFSFGLRPRPVESVERPLGGPPDQSQQRSRFCHLMGNLCNKASFWNEGRRCWPFRCFVLWYAVAVR